jgi:hypothetical protein
MSNQTALNVLNTPSVNTSDIDINESRRPILYKVFEVSTLKGWLMLQVSTINLTNISLLIVLLVLSRQISNQNDDAKAFNAQLLIAQSQFSSSQTTFNAQIATLTQQVNTLNSDVSSSNTNVQLALSSANSNIQSMLSQANVTISQSVQQVNQNISTLANDISFARQFQTQLIPYKPPCIFMLSQFGAVNQFQADSSNTITPSIIQSSCLKGFLNSSNCVTATIPGTYKFTISIAQVEAVPDASFLFSVKIQDSISGNNGCSNSVSGPGSNMFTSINCIAIINMNLGQQVCVQYNNVRTISGPALININNAMLIVE